jgi:hypothetical protein
MLAPPVASESLSLTALIWQPRNPSSMSGGMEAVRAQNEKSDFSQSCSARRWNAKTRRDRFSGSPRSENSISS